MQKIATEVVKVCKTTKREIFDDPNEGEVEFDFLRRVRDEESKGATRDTTRAR